MVCLKCGTQNEDNNYKCTSCGKILHEEISCPKCGARNAANNYGCTNCGQLLHAQAPVVVQTDDSTLGGLFPKNTSAVIAYYLGIFSIIPFIGIFLGIAGLILGLKGLRIAKQRPEAKGKVHAWVGICAGGFFGLLYLGLTIAIIVGALSGR